MVMDGSRCPNYHHHMRQIWWTLRIWIYDPPPESDFQERLRALTVGTVLMQLRSPSHGLHRDQAARGTECDFLARVLAAVKRPTRPRELLRAPLY